MGARPIPGARVSLYACAHVGPMRVLVCVLRLLAWPCPLKHFEARDPIWVSTKGIDGNEYQVKIEEYAEACKLPTLLFRIPEQPRDNPQAELGVIVLHTEIRSGTCNIPSSWCETGIIGDSGFWSGQEAQMHFLSHSWGRRNRQKSPVPHNMPSVYVN